MRQWADRFKASPNQNGCLRIKTEVKAGSKTDRFGLIGALRGDDIELWQRGNS
jgi:hypothetical protein